MNEQAEKVKRKTGNRNAKLWITIKVKAQYSHCGVPETVGIYYNPYNETVKSFIEDWIIPEFRHQVYGYKHS